MNQSSQNKALLEQLNRLKANSLIQQCIVTIEDLQLQLQRERKINEQQKHLIQILQESKEYYENQYKSNLFQKEYTNLKMEFNRVSALANTQKKVNHQLRQKVQELSQHLDQKTKQIEIYQQSLYQLKLQKQLLQKEWNKAIKAVKQKIMVITKEKESIVNPQMNKENTHRNSASKPKIYNKHNNKNIDLISRAQNMIKEIQKQETIQQFQAIFLKSSNRKQKESYCQPKERRVMNELSQNALVLDYLSS